MFHQMSTYVLFLERMDVLFGSTAGVGSGVKSLRSCERNREEV